MALAVGSSQNPAKYTDLEYQDTHHAIFHDSLIQPLESVLPPGISRQEFEQTLAELVEAVGKEFVLVNEALLEYIDPYELRETEGQRKAPSAAVCPKNVDELKAVLRVVNKRKIPVWTFSRGKNLGYGGPAPVVNGSIALDLHRMNKIIEVSADFAYAVVEPGVTFTDLYDYCKEHKLAVWPSTPSLGWGSVIGNTVDRGTGFLPTATHWQNIAGLEIVLADGDVMRTGQFGITNSKSAHISKFTFGPSVEGLFLQSNLGIVTKLGIWLTPQPQAYLSCALGMPNIEDVATIVDIFAKLRMNGVVPTTVYVSNILEWLAMTGQRQAVWSEEGPISQEKIEELQEKLGMGYWNAHFRFYGPKGVIQAQLDEVKKIVARDAPTGQLHSEMFSAEEGEFLDAASVPEPHGGMMVGVPSLFSLPMVKYRLPLDGSGIAGHADYSPIIPSSGKEILEWVQASRIISEKQGYDLFCDFFMHERHVVFVNFLTFDKTNPGDRKAVTNILTELHKEGASRGYSGYRSHVNWMDTVSKVYDFNDYAYRRFVENLKGTLDPNGILSPGKQGIWPHGSQNREESIKAKPSL